MKARFLLSTLTEFPQLKNPKGQPLVEVIIAGRSNVGKSSLINHLFQSKKLAKTSSTPGKTRLLNFFLVDERFLLVDLPGYGFAKGPAKEVFEWSDAIETYIHNRPTLKLILLLVDCRRDFSKEDLALIDFAKAKEIALLLIFTKTDKLSSEEKKKLQETYPQAIACSVKDPSSRNFLERKLKELL